jgi:hypothetical protein
VFFPMVSNVWCRSLALGGPNGSWVWFGTLTLDYCMVFFADGISISRYCV